MFSFVAHNVRERHMAIKPVMGTFEQEDQADLKLMLLTWLLPLIVAMAAFIDIILITMTMSIFHPWKNIIQEGTGLHVEPQRRAEVKSLS